MTWLVLDFGLDMEFNERCPLPESFPFPVWAWWPRCWQTRASQRTDRPPDIHCCNNCRGSGPARRGPDSRRGGTLGLSAIGVLELLGKIAGATVVIWIVSAKLLPRVMALLQRFLNVPELSYGLLIGGLFLVVVGAERLGGLHGSLGALCSAPPLRTATPDA